MVEEASANKDALIESVIRNVIFQMDIDRKAKALKQLQGHIWLDAYKSGLIKGQLVLIFISK